MATFSVTIESIARRKGGSHPYMPPTAENPDGVNYHFIPSATDERHLCPVSDAAHMARFLAIPEGYRIVGALAGSAPALSVDVDGGGAGGGASIEPLAVDPATPLADMTEDQLRAQFLAEVGRNAGPRAKPETMIAQIETARAEQAAIAATP